MVLFLPVPPTVVVFATPLAGPSTQAPPTLLRFCGTRIGPAFLCRTRRRRPGSEWVKSLRLAGLAENPCSKRSLGVVVRSHQEVGIWQWLLEHFLQKGSNKNHLIQSIQAMEGWKKALLVAGAAGFREILGQASTKAVLPDRWFLYVFRSLFATNEPKGKPSVVVGAGRHL